MSTNKKPAGTNGGQVTRSGRPSCQPDHSMVAISAQLNTRRQQFDEIGKAGECAASELVHKQYLNGKTEAWAAGRRP
jgi:hypothetical protein